MNKERFLHGSRVLFLGLQHYDYHIHIHNALNKAGAQTSYFSVEKYWFPQNLVYTLLRNTSRRLWLNFNEAYSRSILEQTKNEQFDYVLVIQGFQHSEAFYSELRRRNPNAVFINYNWDPVMETVFGNTYLDIIPFFDRVYSFDRKDVEAHANLNYLPLFYCETYEQLANATPAAVHDIDLLFIGTLWELRRYDYLKRLIDICAIHDIRFHHYLRCSCRLYCRTLMKGRVLKDVRFRSLGQRDIVEYFRRTRVVIDLPHLFQTGLTMRVFEALGAGRRLITTNKYIRQEPFYDDQYISIIDPDSLAIDVDFVKQATIRRNPKIEEYSISNWLKTLFAGKQ